MATNQVYQQYEAIDRSLPEWRGSFSTIYKLIKKGDVKRVGERDFRVPALTESGGRVGTYNPDGGGMGRGTAQKGVPMIGTFYSLRCNFELTELAVESTKNSEVAIYNAMTRALRDGVPEFSQYCDKFFHSDGTAVVGTAIAQTTDGGDTVYTMDDITRAQHLRKGMPVIVYQNDLSAARDAGAARIIKDVDYDAKTVRLTGTVTGAANDDKLTFEGVSGANPVGLRGLYYYNSDAKVGTTAGINRAENLEIVANSVDAGGVPTHMKGIQLCHKIMDRRADIPDDLVVLCSTWQQANIYSEVQNIAMYDQSRGNEKNLTTDRGRPGVVKEWQYANMRAILDIHQKTDRLDAIRVRAWIRAELKPLGLIQLPGSGQRYYPLYNSGDGSPAASVWFGLNVHEDYVYRNPGIGGYIKNCSKPSY